MNIKGQTLTQKKGEIKFRNLITEQHLGKEFHFKQEYNKYEMLEELKKRLLSTEADFAYLKEKRVRLNNFVEIGAEYGLRSSFLMSKFRVQGIALDLARSPLEATSKFTKLLKLKKVPRRICADVHSLPFADNSISFVFCYQTLHHFPNPLLVVNEIKRVLQPGGYFFFAEEPIKQQFNLRLYRRPTKQYGLNKFFKKILLLPFISQTGQTEVDYGIVEETFSLSLWQKILDSFSIIELTIKPLLGKQNNIDPHLSPRKIEKQISFLTRVQLDLFGGGIKALLQKEIAVKSQKKAPKLICPSCHRSLTKKGLHLYCFTCHVTYKTIKGVIQLTPIKLTKVLYPLL